MKTRCIYICYPAQECALVKTMFKPNSMSLIQVDDHITSPSFTNIKASHIQSKISSACEENCKTYTVPRIIICLNATIATSQLTIVTLVGREGKPLGVGLRLGWGVSIGGECSCRTNQWSIMRKLPDTILFSRRAPDGMSIRSPWLAMIITVPYNIMKTS